MFLLLILCKPQSTGYGIGRMCYVRKNFCNFWSMYTNTFGASTKGGKLREKNFDIMRFFILYMPSTILIFFGHKKKDFCNDCVSFWCTGLPLYVHLAINFIHNPGKGGQGIKKYPFFLGHTLREHIVWLTSVPSFRESFSCAFSSHGEENVYVLPWFSGFFFFFWCFCF